MRYFWCRLSSALIGACPTQAAPRLEIPSPFILEERLEEVTPNGNFTPRAALWLSPRVGVSGLLSELSPGELHLLLGVMGCLSANGTFLATSGRVAGLLGLPHRVARQGLEGLCLRIWQGQPLIQSHSTPSGLRFFAPSLHLLEMRRNVIAPAPRDGEGAQAPQTRPQREPLRIGGREALLAHSRALYARPRAEVEAEIEAFLASGRAGALSIPGSAPVGHATGSMNEPLEEVLIPAVAPLQIAQTPEAAGLSQEADTPQTLASPEAPTTVEARDWLLLKRALVQIGMSEHRADGVMADYGTARVRRQLEWLPRRQARNPVAYLLAAIEHDYAPPVQAAHPSITEEGGRS